MVRVDDAARDLLRDFARKHGVSVSALLEAIARNLPADDELNAVHRATLEEARTIDADRRRRD